MQEKEVFYNGFCRCQNQGRIVLCVYVKDSEKWQIDEIDCGFLNCPHRDSCEVGNIQGFSQEQIQLKRLQKCYRHGCKFCISVLV